jgi:hypothetical protein
LVEPEDPRWTRQNAGWVYAENYICPSTDGGRTWSAPQPVNPAPPRGGFQVISSPVYELGPGRFMLIFEPFYTESLGQMEHEVAATYSDDRGRTWSDKTIVAKDPGGRLAYFDPRLAQLSDGRWVCLFWTHDKTTDESLQTTIAWSEDGRRWTAPETTPLWGFLALPVVLADGRLLAVYNHRRTPQGIRCAVSEDGGKTWDMNHEYVLWDQRLRRVTGERTSESIQRAWEGGAMTEMFSFDFGVPHPALLDDGSVFVTFYATTWDHLMHQRYVRCLIT